MAAISLELKASKLLNCAMFLINNNKTVSSGFIVPVLNLLEAFQSLARSHVEFSGPHVRYFHIERHRESNPEPFVPAKAKQST